MLFISNVITILFPVMEREKVRKSRMMKESDEEKKRRTTNIFIKMITRLY